MTDAINIETNCTHCGARVSVPAPGRYRCPQCEQVVDVRAPEDITAPDAEPIACANHPDRVADSVCTVCGKLVCPACYGERDGSAVCFDCSREHSTYAPPPAWPPQPQVGPYGVAPPPAPAGEPIPFESDDSSDVIGGFFRAIGGAIFRPRAFFERIWPTQKVGRAILFGMIIRTLVALGAVFVFWVQMNSPEFIEMIEEAKQGFSTMPPPMQEAINDAFDQIMNSAFFPILMAIMSPITAAFALFTTALIVHLVLAVSDGSKLGLPATIKVVSYSYAVQVLLIFPLSAMPEYGQQLGLMWQMCVFFIQASIITIGLAVVHRTGGVRAAIAGFAPLILLMLTILVVGTAGAV